MKQGVVMADIAIHNVRDLGQDARRTLEALLGRRLAEGEQVSVTALAARPAPSGDERRIATERLLESSGHQRPGTSRRKRARLGG